MHARRNFHFDMKYLISSWPEPGRRFPVSVIPGQARPTAEELHSGRAAEIEILSWPSTSLSIRVSSILKLVNRHHKLELRSAADLDSAQPCRGAKKDTPA